MIGVDCVVWEDGVFVVGVGEFCGNKGVSVVGELWGGDCCEMLVFKWGFMGGSLDFK